jgi:hypothetical protein
MDTSTRTTNVGTTTVPSYSVCIYHYTTTDEVKDDDEYNEILDNLQSMGNKIGPVEEVLIPRDRESDNDDDDDDDGDHHPPVFIMF